MWRDSGVLVHRVIVSCVTVLAAVSAFALSIPARHQRWKVWSSAIALAAWLTWIVGVRMTGSEPHAGVGWKCLRDIAALGVPLGMLMYYLIKRPRRCGLGGRMARRSQCSCGRRTGDSSYLQERSCFARTGLAFRSGAGDGLHWLRPGSSPASLGNSAFLRLEPHDVVTPYFKRASSGTPGTRQIGIIPTNFRRFLVNAAVR
jgi:hypothetical protein